MYTAEHLDLITNVRDNFTDDLTRLGTLLEEIGIRADVLDPIRIRVNVVNEGDLRQTERRLARLQGLDATTSASSATGIAASADGGSASAMADGGRGNRIYGFDQIDNIEDSFGLDLTPTLPHRDASPGRFLDDEAPLFGVTPEEITEQISPERLARGFDMEAFVEASDIDFGDRSPRRILSGMRPSQMLQSIPDEMADSLDEFTDQFFNRRRLQLEQFKESILDVRVGMTQFYDILAAFMPLMIVFVGAIPAVVGALGGLATAAVGAAGALAGIAGLGFLGAATAEAGGDMPGMEDFTDVLEDIPDEFMEAFRPLAERLAPTFERGLDGLSRLFDRLADASTVLLDLRDDARAFGQWVIPFTSNLAESLFRVSEAARPVFSLIADGLESRDIIAGFANALAQALPQLTRLTSIIFDALPGLVSFSSGMLAMSTNILHAVSSAWGFLTTMIEFIPLVDDGNRFLSILVGTLLTMSSALFLTSKLTAVYQSRLAQLVISKMMAANWTRLLTASFYKEAAGAITAQAGVMSLSGALVILKRVMAGILAMTGIGLVLVAIGEAVTFLSGQFSDLDGNVSDATDSLREFQRQSNRVGDYGGAYLGDLDRTVYVDVTEENREFNFEGDSREQRRNAETASFVDGNTGTY